MALNVSRNCRLWWHWWFSKINQSCALMHYVLSRLNNHTLFPVTKLFSWLKNKSDFFFQLHEHIMSSSKSQSLWPHHLPWSLVSFRQCNSHRWSQNASPFPFQSQLSSYGHKAFLSGTNGTMVIKIRRRNNYG